LAEDSEVNRHVAVALLEKCGYQVDAVADGGQALDAVRETEYDIVLMDIQMPIMDGLEATRRIRALPDGSDVPVVALTARSSVEERERCGEAGMNDFLAKPFNPDDLYRLVERWTSPDVESYERSERDGSVAEGAETHPVDIESFRATMREVGIEEIVDSTLALFQSEAPGMFGALEQAIGSGDADGIRRHAHGLKSSSGNIRATRLAGLLRQLESLGREGDVSGADGLFPDVEREYHAVMDYLAGS
jgi:CheY-like chemotaxis protein